MFKLLIVDDEEITRKGLVNFINWSQLDLEVIADVNDGQKALDIFAQNPADIVISDIRMPNMDGLELAEGIKTADPSAIIILLSAYDDFKYAQKAIKLGVFDYILKPIDVDALTTVIKNAINFKKQNSSRYSDITALMSASDHDFYTSDILNAVLKMQDELLRALKSGDALNSQRILVDIWQELLSKKAKLDFVKRFSSELFSQFIRCVIAIQEKPDFLINDTDSRIAISQMESQEDIHLWLDDIISKICDAVHNRKGKQIKLVKEVLKYIDENYTDSKLTLSTVAEKLYFSPNYLSAVFKDSMGICFLEFLTNYRLEKSKGLLADIKFKIYEISSAVGYSDPHYFSKIFKESTGMTPKEYREKTV